jgi:diguanylate cyclase (GGDEF)-like protein
MVSEQLGEDSLALRYQRQAAKTLLDESRHRAYKQLAVLDLSRQLQQIRESNALLTRQKQLLKNALVDSKKAQQTLKYWAEHDELTGLLNRRGLESWFQTHLVVGKQYEIWFLDLNNFKQVNDRFGHASGDDILIQLGKLIQDLSHQGCIGARIGGDEFVLIVEPERHLGDTIIDKINQGLQFRFQDQHEVEVTATSGVIRFVCGGPGATLYELMKRADSAMYSKKPVQKNESSRLQKSREDPFDLN